MTPSLAPDAEVARRAGRGAERTASALEVGIRRSGGRWFRVGLFDLSPQGCKMEFVDRPELGECVWVKFDGLQGIAARVRWIAGHVGGVRFEDAMHEAIFRRLVG